MFSRQENDRFEDTFIKERDLVLVNQRMGLVRLKIREFAAQKDWTLKEVAKRSEVPYTTVTTYARSTGMAMADVSALLKLARVFGVSIEDLIEVVED